MSKGIQIPTFLYNLVDEREFRINISRAELLESTELTYYDYQG